MFPIFDKMGGFSNATRILRPHASSPTNDETWPSKHTVVTWGRPRNRRLPAYLQPICIEYCERNRIKFSSRDFYMPDDLRASEFIKENSHLF